MITGRTKVISLRSRFGDIESPRAFWWPDYDHRPDANYRRVVARLPDADIAARYSRRHDLVVQAGGHLGFWPLRLSTQFSRVLTYECDPVCFRCLQLNVADTPNVSAHPHALGASMGSARMRKHPSAGSWCIADDGTVPVRQITVDSLSLEHCDALVLDVEAHEAEVLRGALETIERCNPVIHVEVSYRGGDELRGLISGLGYDQVFAVHSDAVFRRIR